MNEEMRIQTDWEFEQNETKRLKKIKCTAVHCKH